MTPWIVAAVGVLVTLFIGRLLWWGGPWLVVWHFQTQEPIYWPCFTHRGAERKQRQMTQRLPFYRFTIEKRRW